MENPLEVYETLPIVPLRDVVVFPAMVVPLFVSREISLNAVEFALAAEQRLLFAVAQRDPNDDAPRAPDGVYRLDIDSSKAPTDPHDWHFVVADHKCNTTDILSFPHEPKPPQVVR